MCRAKWLLKTDKIGLRVCQIGRHHLSRHGLGTAQRRLGLCWPSGEIGPQVFGALVAQALGMARAMARAAGPVFDKADVSA
jgi:hypothetical protein